MSNSTLSEAFLKIIPLVAAVGYSAEVHQCRFLCGETFRLGIRREDGTLDQKGFKGSTADMIYRSLEKQYKITFKRKMKRQDAPLPLGWNFRVPWYDTIKDTTQLIRAAIANDENRIRILLTLGANPNVNCDNGSALYFACRNGNTKIIKLLIDAGADIDYQNEETGWTPLMTACKHENINACKILLTHNANYLLTNYHGHTVFHIAVGTHQKEIVRMILDYGYLHCGCHDQKCCNCQGIIDKRDNYGITAEDLLIENPNILISQILDNWRSSKLGYRCKNTCRNIINDEPEFYPESWILYTILWGLDREEFTPKMEIYGIDRIRISRV